jgi:hypothetical protein
MLERPAKRQRRRALDAACHRRMRARAKAGKAVFQVEIDEHSVAEALINSLRLTEAEAADRKHVARALGTLIAEWAAQWRRA